MVEIFVCLFPLDGNFAGKVERGGWGVPIVIPSEEPNNNPFYDPLYRDSMRSRWVFASFEKDLVSYPDGSVYGTLYWISFVSRYLTSLYKHCLQDAFYNITISS